MLMHCLFVFLFSRPIARLQRSYSLSCSLLFHRPPRPLPQADSGGGGGVPLAAEAAQLLLLLLATPGMPPQLYVEEVRRQTPPQKQGDAHAGQVGAVCHDAGMPGCRTLEAHPPLLNRRPPWRR